MKQTIEELYDIYQQIKRFQSAYEDEGSLRFFRNVAEEINAAEQNGFISKDMAQEYRKVLVGIRDRGIDVNEGIQELIKICNQQTEDCEKADRQMSEAFYFNWKNDGEKIDDSKKSLQHINDLIGFYEAAYSKNNQLESVDVFCELVNGIKEAFENKNISEATAKALIEPLQDIKKNIFNDKIREEKMAEFSRVLQNKISNGKEEKGVFRSIVDGIDSLNIGKNGEKAVEKPDINNNKEQIENFEIIKRELLKKYNRAQVYSGMHSMPETAEAYSYVVSVLRPLVDICKDLDLSKNKEKLKDFASAWKSVPETLYNVNNYLKDRDSAYDDVWDDMGQFVNFTDDFLKNANLNQKESNVSALGKKETQHTMNATDTAKTQDEADKALETQRQATKENSSRNNETQEKAVREQVSKNEEQKEPLQQQKALNPRTVAQDQARLNEQIGQLKPQEQVNTQTQQEDKVFNIKDNSEEAGRKRIQAMKEKHGIKFRDGHEAGVLIPKNIAEIMRSELGNSDIEKKYYEDIRKFVYDYTGIFNNGKGQDIGDFREKTKPFLDKSKEIKPEEKIEDKKTEELKSKFNMGQPKVNEPKKEDRIRREDMPSFRDGIRAITAKYAEKEERTPEQTHVPTQQPDRHAVFKEQLQRKEPLQQPKALDPRTAAQDQARLNEQIGQLKPQEQVNTPTQQPDRFAAFREQLQRKEPLQQNENGEKPKVDKPAAFKEGIEKTKQLAQNNQQKMMALFKKKYKDGWSDY